ncbi:MAG: glycosyltransferase family 4 protein [Gammaproteobacteria bacterium]
MRRIAIVYDCAYPFVQGGGQKRLYEIATRLLDVGWRVDWYALKSWSGPDELEHQGIVYKSVGKAVDLYGDDGKRSIKETLYFGMKVLCQARLGGYDLIHAGQWPYFHLFPAWVYGSLGRARLVVDWWEVWGAHWYEYYGRKGFLGVQLEKLCSRLPHGIVSISEIGRDQLRAIGVPDRRMRVIHNGIDFEAIQRAPRKDADYTVVYMGRLQQHKNVDHLVRAVAMLRDSGRAVNLQIIGDGPERNALEVLAGQLGVADAVTFHGRIDSDEEVYGWLKASRLFVHPSTKEGGGSITALEANAAGLPVVAYRHPHGISQELIEDGRNGFWVENVGAEALADGIAHALDSDDATGQSERAVDFASAFDWSALSAQYDGYFRSLIGSLPREASNG